MTYFRQLNREYDDMLERNHNDPLDDPDEAIIFKESRIEEYMADPWIDQLICLSEFLEEYDGEDAAEIDDVFINCLDRPQVKSLLEKAFEARAEARYQRLLETEEY